MTKKNIPKKFWDEEDKKKISQLPRKKLFSLLRNFGKQHNIPNISPKGEEILKFFLRMKKPKKVLEIGCANGYSSCVIANEIEKFSGSLLTGDISNPSIESAKINAKIMKLNNIEFRTGNALEVFSKKKDGKFDFIFIDGQKSWTHKFFQLAKNMLNESGIILVDDTKKFPEKMKSFKNMIEKEKKEWIFFEIPDSEDDAMMIFTKKNIK